MLAIDIDHPDGLERVERLAAAYGLPRPTLIVDPWSGRAHALLRLLAPVRVGTGAGFKAQKLLHVAGEMLAAALGGTLLPHQALLKSPWGLTENLIGARLRRTPAPAVPALWDAYEASASPLMWHTVPGDAQAVTLGEVVAALGDDYADALPAPVRRWMRNRGEPSAYGRNCHLFDLTRWWAYDNACRDADAVLAEAERVNAGFADPLPANEVKGVARSIARFMQKRWTGRCDPKPRRDDDAGKGMTPGEKRALAGRVTAAAVKGKVDAAIATALEAMRAAGQRVTQAALALAAGVSARSVAARWGSLTGPVEAVAEKAPPGVPTACNTVRLSASVASMAAPEPRSGEPSIAKKTTLLPLRQRVFALWSRIRGRDPP